MQIINRSKKYQHIFKLAIKPGGVVPFEELHQMFGKDLCMEKFQEIVLAKIKDTDLELM